jgi:hypothetical protein
MKKLKMTGHDKTTKKYVSAEELKKVSGGNSKGFFATDTNWNDSGDPIVVTFTNTTFINKTLAGKEKSDVETHEGKHFSDFKALATKMKADIEKALKARLDPQMQDRIDWLLFDRCLKSAALHRQTAGFSVEICDKPSSTRPT